MEYYHIEIPGTDETEMMPILPAGLEARVSMEVDGIQSAGAMEVPSGGYAGPLSLRIAPQIAFPVAGAATVAAGQGITEEKLAEVVSRTMASLKVYVVESEITEAQDRVKAIVRQASY